MQYEAALQLKTQLVKEFLIPAVNAYNHPNAPAHTGNTGNMDMQQLQIINGVAIVQDTNTAQYQVKLYTREPYFNFNLPPIAQTGTDEILIEYIGDIYIAGLPVPGDYISYPDGATGTVACYVTDKANKTHLLSNNHVLTNYCSGNLGDPVLHPGVKYTGMNAIARVSKCIPIDFSGKLNELDCGMAELLEQPTTLINQLPTIGRVNQVGEAQENDLVQKSGFGTKWTTGKVTSIDADIAVNYGSTFFKRKEAIFHKQLEIRGNKDSPCFASMGDSGSLVVEYQSSNKALGLLFSATHKGIAFANPISKVLAALMVDIL